LFQADIQQYRLQNDHSKNVLQIERRLSTHVAKRNARKNLSFWRGYYFFESGVRRDINAVKINFNCLVDNHTMKAVTFLCKE
jgi:hypothetical protein